MIGDHSNYDDPKVGFMIYENYVFMFSKPQFNPS